MSCYPIRLKAEDGKFRFRSYLQAKAGVKNILFVRGWSFFQSEKLNTYSGGISRKYPEIKQDVAEEIMNLVFEANYCHCYRRITITLVFIK